MLCADIPRLFLLWEMSILNDLGSGAILNSPPSARIIQEPHEQDQALSYLAQMLVDAYLEQRNYARTNKTD